MNRAGECGRLPGVGLLGTLAEEGAAAGRLGPGWWLPALAASERSPRASRPTWVDVVEHAVTAAAALPPARRSASASLTEAFAVPLRSFLLVATDRFVAGARLRLPDRQVDVAAVAAAFSPVLGRQLARTAVRTMAPGPGPGGGNLRGDAAGAGP